MIDPKQQAELEQAEAAIIEFYPSLWRKLHVRLVLEGVTEAQALELVKTYILSNSGSN